MDEPIDDSLDRRPAKGFAHWFLVGGDRVLVALVMLLAIGAVFVGVAMTGIATVTTPRRVMWYLNGTVNGLLTLVPITVGVNQIVLSHEFGSIQALYDRRTDITEFRERIEEHTDADVVSPHASELFQTILSAISNAAGDLREQSWSIDQIQRDIDAFAESVSEQADRVNDELAADGSSMVRTLLIMLSYDDAHQFHETRRLQMEFSGSDQEAPEELGVINELFVEVDTARQFLKTVVVERQLARLSRLLIYTGIPAVTIAAVAIFSYRDIAGLTLPRPVLVGIASVVIVTTLVPLAILGSFILRVATIALQTATFGPFVPESAD